MAARAIFEFLHRHRLLVQVAFVVAVTGAYVWLNARGFVPLQNWENRVLDFRFAVRGARPPPPEIVILGVDERAFSLEPPHAGDLPELSYLVNRWPWDRRLWGRLAEMLFQSGARIVGYDFLFSDPKPEDAAVGAVFEKYAAHLVITARFSAKEGTLGTEHAIDGPSDDLIPLQGPEIVGLANVEEDDDGIQRRLIQGYNHLLLQRPALARDPALAGKLQPDLFAFSWLAAEKYLGFPPARDPAAPMILNFYGPAGTIPTLLIEDVLENWNTFYRHGAAFRGKVVFVGPLSEVRFKDSHATPWRLLPGVEVQATAFANLADRDWLRSVPAWIVPALAVVFGLTALLICLRVHAALAKIGLLLALALPFAVVTQWLFVRYFLIVPAAGAALGIIVCGGFGTIYDFALEQYERRRMLGVFESMVSPGVAKLVLADRADFAKRLGGQRKQLVILFSDIRGFTTWSEKVGPDALVAQLNEYFLEMVRLIMEEDGTVQKYIGDALMAAWGDVHDTPPAECAAGAVRAALRMKEAMTRLNAGWAGRPGREQLSFGVGINLGEGVVGCIGHPRRQEFTVMGDTVNVAARLESATKQYHQAILVGESIYEATRAEFAYRLADKMQVKGKTFGVPVYAPVGPRADAPPPGQAEYEAALGKFFARDFAGAAVLFAAANEKFGGGDFLCENFIGRCRFYQQSPPPPDWDGTWVLKEK